VEVLKVVGVPKVRLVPKVVLVEASVHRCCNDPRSPHQQYRTQYSPWLPHLLVLMVLV
jgi:hypothetical protein